MAADAQSESEGLPSPLAAPTTASPRDIGNRAGVLVAVGIVLAGAMIATAVGLRPRAQPAVHRYTMSVRADGVVRLDRFSGEMVHCTGEICLRLKSRPDELFEFDSPDTGSAPAVRGKN